ncbi:hypothetical protein GCM10022236_45450 [Microlunatus ginsengisoli]|uniref:Uncharacterized protein n=1 Tax=Microlunatus ginsengisoli TaxID=363863 RepID=A0ABP7AR08_9ACTN
MTCRTVTVLRHTTHAASRDGTTGADYSEIPTPPIRGRRRQPRGGQPDERPAGPQPPRRGGVAESEDPTGPLRSTRQPNGADWTTTRMSLLHIASSPARAINAMFIRRKLGLARLCSTLLPP